MHQEEVTLSTPNFDVLFNPERLRVSHAFDQLVGVKKLLTVVPVRKPNRQSFVRVHSDPLYRLDVALLELKEEREIYLVEPQLLPELPGEAAPYTLFTTITRQGDLSLWPVRLPDASGRSNSWSMSALEAAKQAIEQWIRVVANLAIGGYEVYVATGNFPEPEWPKMSFQDLLKIAFGGDKFIRSVS
jgi:hypothetical protein